MTADRSSTTAHPCRASSVLTTPVARGCADEPVEGSRERRLIAESGLARDVDEGNARPHEQLLRVFGAPFHQPAMATDAEAHLEGAREMADRQVARSREIRQPNPSIEAFAQELRRSPSLPAGEASS